MFDISFLDDPDAFPAPKRQYGLRRALFPYAKRGFDIGTSIVLLPPLLFCALVLVALNPFYNPGRLFFVQMRMGQNCQPFRAIKFRSMRDVPKITRNADDPLETDRIMPLGAFIRKTRIDELPQIFNVLCGQMSLIGPRPDFYDHALEYLEAVPGYRERYQVRPGISGLAQTELGYAAGLDATARKVQADLYYVANAGFRLEGWIFWRTLGVIINRKGT